MTFRPLHDHLVIRRLTQEPGLIGSMVIPDSAREKPQRGQVLAAGLGRFNEDGGRIPPDVKAGETVLFGKYSGQEVRLDGVEYLILKESDVLGIDEGRI